MGGTLAALGDWMPLTPEELAKLVDGYRTESEDGHERLRKDFRTYHEQTELTIVLLRDGQNTLRGRVDLIERTPPDVTKLRFPTGVVVAIVLATISVITTGVTVSNRVTGRIDALSSEMTRQSEDDKKERANLAKLYDERNGRYEKSIDTLARQVELLKYEQQRLREDVTKKNGSTR